MVIGQSKHFSLDRNGVNISEYTAYYQLKKEGILKKTGIVHNTGTKLEIKIETVGLSAGTYDLRVFITDPVDGFVDLYRERFTLED